jgi:hypothetical protein
MSTSSLMTCTVQKQYAVVCLCVHAARLWWRSVKRSRESQCFTKKKHTVPWHSDRKISTLLEQASFANTRWKSPEVLREARFVLETALATGEMQVCIFIWRALLRLKSRKQEYSRTSPPSGSTYGSCTGGPGLKSRPARRPTILGSYRGPSQCLQPNARRS